MYSKEFCGIYNEYGWDYFSLTMGDAILKYLNKKINPDIIFIPKIENIYTKSIEEKKYKYNFLWF